MSVWLDLILDLFFPPKCMFCGALIERSSMVICNDCMLSELPEGGIFAKGRSNNPIVENPVSKCSLFLFN